MRQKNQGSTKPAGKQTKPKQKRKGARSRTSAKAIELARKRQRALELRVEGKTLQEIADDLGYANVSSVSRLLQAAVEEIPRETADNLRKVHKKKLEKLWRMMIDQKQPIVGVKVLAREAKLLGLDAPTLIKGDFSARIMNVSTGELAEQAAEALRELGATVIPPKGGWPEEKQNG